MLTEAIPTDFAAFIRSESFPCVGAKSALALGRLTAFEAGRLESPDADEAIHAALSDFAGRLDTSSPAVSTFVVLFRAGRMLEEEDFEAALWRRLQGLHDIDAANGRPWAPNVSADPSSPQFSMSIAGLPWFVVGLHPGASRPARRFSRPAMVFNSHEQFERLRADGRYASMQAIVRKREVAHAGGLNPMLAEFGDGAEAPQYSGRRVGPDWVCPFKARM